jgi:hypothetical protein
LEHLNAHRSFVRQTKGGYTSHLPTKRLKVAKAAGIKIFTTHQTRPHEDRRN